MLFLLVGTRRSLSHKFSGSSSSSSKISTRQVKLILEKLVCQSQRNSTCKNYLAIWRQFNKFVINLDSRPKTWEDRVNLFIGFKIDNGMQSATVKSHVSAIKKFLVDDGYPWDDQKELLGSLTKSCKLINDRVHTRLPIQCSLLEMILFEIQRYFHGTGQVYLHIMYKALFAIAYYGLMRISEVTQSDHVVKAKDVHLALNKCKLKLVLYSSKTTYQRYEAHKKIIITSNAN